MGDRNRIYVGNLPDDVKEREIEDLFRKYGRIRNIEMKRNRDVDRSFCFVSFEDSRDAEDAIRGRDGTRFGDLRIRVEFPGDRGRREPPSYGYGAPPARGPPASRTDFRIVVTGLPHTASWQDLKDTFRKIGNVGYANVDRTGLGVVEFTSEEDMRRAMKEMDKAEFKNPFHTATIRVYREKDYQAGAGRDRSRSRDRKKEDRSRSRGRDRSRSRSKDRKRDRSRSRSGERRDSKKEEETKRDASRSRSRDERRDSEGDKRD